MKNKLRKMLMLMCAMMLALALTACGGSKDPEPAEDNTTEEDAAADDDAAAEDDAAEDDAAAEDDTDALGRYSSIQEFIESDEMKSSLDSQIASLEGSGMEMEVTGEDNKLVYTFTITDPDLSALMDAAALETSLDEQASTFESVASILPLAIDVENPVVVVRYVGADGAELASREFAPSDDSADTAE